jgi:hypothetical protein
VARLPYQWRVKFLQSLELRMPTFENLVGFVKNSSLFVRNPFFGHCFDQSSKSNKRKDTNRQRAVNDAHYNESDSHCPAHDQLAKCELCDSTQRHPPWHCRLLREMTVKDRVAPLMKANRCLNCLISIKHVAERCTKETFCKDRSCTRSLAHNSFCHPLPRLRELFKKPDSENVDQGPSQPTSCSNF